VAKLVVMTLVDEGLVPERTCQVSAKRAARCQGGRRAADVDVERRCSAAAASAVVVVDDVVRTGDGDAQLLQP